MGETEENEEVGKVDISYGVSERWGRAEQSKLKRKRNGCPMYPIFPSFFLNMERDRENRQTDGERDGISSTLKKIFNYSPLSWPVLLVAVPVCVKGCVEKKRGSYPPPWTKGADGWPDSGLGWGGASRRLRRSAGPSHGVHFSSSLKETADRGPCL